MSTEAFISYMEVAKKLYLDWCKEFYRKGTEAALQLLRKALWTPELMNLEERFKDVRKRTYDELISLLEPPPNHESFPSFSKLPMELQLKIWRYSFVPRIIEIQGGFPISFHSNLKDDDRDDVWSERRE